MQCLKFQSQRWNPLLRFSKGSKRFCKMISGLDLTCKYAHIKRITCRLRFRVLKTRDITSVADMPIFCIAFSMVMKISFMEVKDKVWESKLPVVSDKATARNKSHVASCLHGCLLWVISCCPTLLRPFVEQEPNTGKPF